MATPDDTYKRLMRVPVAEVWREIMADQDDAYWQTRAFLEDRGWTVKEFQKASKEAGIT